MRLSATRSSNPTTGEGQRRDGDDGDDDRRHHNVEASRSDKLEALFIVVAWSFLVGYCSVQDQKAFMLNYGNTMTVRSQRAWLLVALLVTSMVLAFGQGTAVAQDSKDLKEGVPNEGGPSAEGKAPSAAKELTGKDGAPMVLIPAGEFVMGSPDGEGLDNEQPEHRVWVDAFYLDKFEVSNARYERFMEETGRARPKFWEQLDLTVHSELPVIGVSWHDAKAYCEWAEKRLPTEAEWEYAARGTDRRRYPWGNAAPTAQLSNFGKNWSYKFYEDRLEPVVSHESGKSPFGIYNMAGNVFEWVADWYEIKYYVRSPERNPPGPEKGEQKVMRGGSWNFASEYIRTTSRMKLKPMEREADVGIRCARDVQ